MGTRNSMILPEISLHTWTYFPHMESLQLFKELQHSLAAIGDGIWGEEFNDDG